MKKRKNRMVEIERKMLELEKDGYVVGKQLLPPKDWDNYDYSIIPTLSDEDLSTVTVYWKYEKKKTKVQVYRFKLELYEEYEMDKWGIVN